MKTTTTSNWRPLLRAFYPFLIAAAALSAMPRNARAQLYVTQRSPDGIVSKYNATTGTLIKAHFITGVNDPSALALLDNELFVANKGSGSVGEYDATTGAAINASFITGLNTPSGLAVMGPTSVFFHSILFVVNNSFGSGTVGEYDATTGTLIKAHFITGLNQPQGLAVLGNTLFVANFGSGTVGKYDATTGAAINANFITGLNVPVGLAAKSAK